MMCLQPAMMLMVARVVSFTLGVDKILRRDLSGAGPSVLCTSLDFAAYEIAGFDDEVFANMPVLKTL